MKNLYLFKILITLFIAVRLIAIEEGNKVVNISEKNRIQITKLKLKINRIEEEIDGLRSVIEASNEQKIVTSKIINKIKSLSGRVDKLEISIDKILKLLSSLEKDSDNNNKNIEKNKKVLKKKKDIERHPIKKLSGRDLFKKAYKLYKRKKYEEARSYFLDLAEKKYKEASSFFYIAETLYYQKRYEEAIVYYKKSIYKYDKPKYLSTLLLHTGICFFKIGNKQGAKKFLQATIDGFPDSKNAKIAIKYIKKL